MSKHIHALETLLSSERAYASDLAIIRDIYIPLLLGRPDQPALSSSHRETPPLSSSTTSIVSTATDSSTSTLLIEPAITQTESKIIFNNIAELAISSDMFAGRLEQAFLKGGVGDDHVGELFLDVIPTMGPLYKKYVTRHSRAISFLSALPSTPALTAGLSRCNALVVSLSDARDLPSLLAKPVQRLLKYSLLLTAIITETSDSHPDKKNLKLAREKMDEVVRTVQEDRRRRQVVKEVLKTKPGEGKGLKGLNLPTSVSLKRTKSLMRGGDKSDNREVAQVTALEKRLKQSRIFINQFVKDAVDWAATAGTTIGALRQWTIGFAQVIGLSGEQRSEAFDAFEVVVEKLASLSRNVESIIHNKLLVNLARLIDTMRAPLRVLEAMNTLEPLHYSLLNTNFAKTRPPPALLEASQSYLALRGQLLSELPQYLGLLDKITATFIMQLAHWQTSYWADVYDRWGGLWDALRIDGEVNASATETSRVWWNRWAEVASVINGLNIVNPKKIYVERNQVVQPQRPDCAVSMLAALNSGYMAPMETSPTSPMSKTGTKSLNNEHRQLRDSMQSGKSTKSRSPKQSQTTEDFSDYAHISMLSPMPALMKSPSRKKSTPLHSQNPGEIYKSVGPSHSLQTARAMYACRVVHPYNPPDGVSYRNLPFFTLQVNTVYDVLKEYGHPSLHEDLPLYVDDGEDCLLLVRDSAGNVGWSLASFLTPTD